MGTRETLLFSPSKRPDDAVRLVSLLLLLINHYSCEGEDIFCCCCVWLEGNKFLQFKSISIMDELAQVKTQLFSSLGEEFKKYLCLLKMWFKGELDKDSFDEEAVKTLSRDQIKLHNKFLITLLTKCQSLAAAKPENKGLKPPVKKKAKKVSEARFRPASPSEFVTTTKTDSSIEKATEYHRSVLRVTFCSGDSILPDNFASHLRMFVITWEEELDSLTDDSVTLLNLAVRDFMKNILTAVLSHKTSFKTKDAGRFKYAFGSPDIDPFLVNSREMLECPTMDQTGDWIPDHTHYYSHLQAIEQQAVLQAACSGDFDEDDSERERYVSLWDLFHALRKYRQAIPSHAVYSMNMARIMAKVQDKDIDSQSIDT